MKIRYNSEGLVCSVAKWATGNLNPVWPRKRNCRACVASLTSCFPIRVFIWKDSLQHSIKIFSSSDFRFICHFIYKSATLIAFFRQIQFFSFNFHPLKYFLFNTCLLIYKIFDPLYLSCRWKRKKYVLSQDLIRAWGPAVQRQTKSDDFWNPATSMRIWIQSL